MRTTSRLIVGKLCGGRARNVRITAIAALALACVLVGPVADSAAASGPTNLEQPALETPGKIAVGETLACWQGDWEGSGLSYTYEWLRGEEQIASGNLYKITPADEGHWLSCIVTATDSEGSTEAHSTGSDYINPPSDIQGGTFSGRALDATTLEGIAGEKVCAENTNGAGPWTCVHTGANGDYLLTVREAGEYTLEFTTPLGGRYVSREYDGGVSFHDQAAHVPVSEGGSTRNIDAVLPEGGRIAGTVTSASTHAPVAAVEVCTRTFAHEGIGESIHNCDRTNSAGEYVISQLPAGSYAVEYGFGYTGPGEFPYVTPMFYKQVLFLAFPSETTEVAVTEGASTAGIDAELEEGGRIEGRVTSALTGKPLEGIEACAYNGDGPSICAQTNSAGEYTITGVAARPNTFTVSFHDYSGNYVTQYYPEKTSELEGERLTIGLNSTTTGINASLRPPCATAVGTGKYLKRGKPGALTMRNNLSIVAGAHEHLTAQTEVGAVHLTHLLSATCTANPYENGEDRVFSGRGEAKLGMQSGYTVSFTVRDYWASRQVSLTLEREGRIIFQQEPVWVEGTEQVE
ncbi:MAG: collagen binding domain-containing protein [Solirubrobacteraceae bacterium]